MMGPIVVELDRYLSCGGTRIAQLLPDRPFLRALLDFVLTNMQGGAPNAERNFGLLLDLLAQLQLISAQDAADLKTLVAPC